MGTEITITEGPSGLDLVAAMIPVVQSAFEKRPVLRFKTSEGMILLAKIRSLATSIKRGDQVSLVVSYGHNSMALLEYNPHNRTGTGIVVERTDKTQLIRGLHAAQEVVFLSA